MTKLVINGSYGNHDFDHQDPLSTLTALRDEATDKAKNAERVLENAENGVIAAKINLESHIAVRDRFNDAIDALVDASAEELTA